MNIKEKLSPSIVKDLHIKMDGQEVCAKGKVEINGLEMRDGISSVELILRANEQPEVTVEYGPHHITEETSKVLGLKKINYE